MCTSIEEVYRYLTSGDGLVFVDETDLAELRKLSTEQLKECHRKYAKINDAADLTQFNGRCEADLAGNSYYVVDTVLFERFVASRNDVDDIGAVLPDAMATGPGFIYCDSYFIKKNGNSYWTIVGWDEQTSADLSVLERWLWQTFVRSEITGG